MRVLKRNGEFTEVEFDEITRKIKFLADFEPKLKIDPSELALKVINQIYDGITTSELDEFTASTASTMSLYNSDYNLLASRLIINNHIKNTPYTFCESMNILKDIISENILIICEKYKEDINKIIVELRDYNLNYFAFCTLKKGYLLKHNNKTIERPQYLFMRVALGIHGNDINNINFEDVKKTYDLLSLKQATHATPTLFNAGTKYPQMSSCYLIGTKDSVDGIYDTIKEVALISKWAGGVGVHISNIRCDGSEIAKTNGTSQGIMPMLKVYNDTARYINQSSKRNGSFAMYLEPWHADIFVFLDAKKNSPADENLRARDLFYALWIPDLFIERVKNREKWSLMCPNKSPGLTDVYGDEFNRLYCKYEAEGKFINQVDALEIWNAIINSQIESGTPYMLYKDHVNNKSNQKNIGIIKSSNLCCEIMEYSDHNETAVCNLASICLPKCLKYTTPTIFETVVYTKDNCIFCDKVKYLLNYYNIFYKTIKSSYSERLDLYEKYTDEENDIVVNTMPQVFINNERIGGYENVLEYLDKIYKPKFDYEKLSEIVKILVKNLNLIIDNNYYPSENSKKSNLKHRPIGIGVQGLADVFMAMNLPFTSLEACKINKEIFECIYYVALEQSMKLSIINGPYETFNDSPASKGILQFDMWKKEPSFYSIKQWNDLKTEIIKNGIRNSLLVAPMPTASTAQIMGNNESFEAFTSNIYTRRVLAGEFILVNDYLISTLKKLDMYNKQIINQIILDRGSIKNINLSNNYKDIFKTVWEISQKKILEMSADRGAFICQSQSLNIFIEDANPNIISSVHLYGHKLGLKTGSYYIRTKPALNSQTYSLSHEETKNIQTNENCISCSA